MQSLKNFFKDGSGKIVVWQTPNKSLSGWIIFAVLIRVLPTETWQRLASVCGFICIVIWALQEVADGSSSFRRVLGLVILITSVLSKFH